MTLNEVLLFNGKGCDMQAYSNAIEKREKLDKSIRRLYEKVYDLKDSIEILEGDERQGKRIVELEKVKKKIAKTEQEYDLLEKFIKDNQGNKE